METTNYSLNNEKKYIIKIHDKFNKNVNTEQTYKNTHLIRDTYVDFQKKSA